MGPYADQSENHEKKKLFNLEDKYSISFILAWI